MSQLVPVEGSNKYLVWDFPPVCHLNTILRWSTTVKRSTLWRTRRRRPLRRTVRSRTTGKLASLQRMSTCRSSSLSRLPSSSSSATWSYRWQKKLFELFHKSEIRCNCILTAWEREARGLTCKQPELIIRRGHKLVLLIPPNNWLICPKVRQRNSKTKQLRNISTFVHQNGNQLIVPDQLILPITPANQRSCSKLFGKRK